MTKKDPAKTVSWGVANRKTIDLFREPIKYPSRLSPTACTRLRQTQTTDHAHPFKIIRAEKDCQLVQLADHTYGWIDKKLIKAVPAKDYWNEILYPKKRAFMKIRQPSPAVIKKVLRQYQTTPYLWGGTTISGIDCSGFTQQIIYRLTKVLLPKNSRDQSKYGQLVKQNILRPLDLAFFVHRAHGTSHVGFYFDSKIWHICLDNQKLVGETLSDMSSHYRFRKARRYFTT